MPTNPTERVLQALPENPRLFLTPHEWYASVNAQGPSVSLAAFCEHVQKLLAVGFISRETAVGDPQGETIVVKFRRTQ